MKRRTELKLESMRIFSKKYIFSSRFIVRNTLSILAAVTLTGGTLLAADIIDNATPAEITSISSQVAEATEDSVVTENYAITLSDDSMIDDTSIYKLNARIEEDSAVLAAANDTTNLTKSEYDMTGKYIVITEGLNLRAEASEAGGILDVFYTGDTGSVLGTSGDWTYVDDGSLQGYVKSEFIIVDDEATKVAEKAAADGKSLRDTIGVKEPETQVAETTTEATTVVAEAETTEAPATEAATTASEEETTTEAPTTEATTVATTEATTEATTAEVQVATSDAYLLGALVYSEAGNQSYEGQLAVASVVMNRLANGYWGNSISSVIYAPYQFAGTNTAAFKNSLATGGTATSLKAAQDALAGANNVGSCMYFRPTWNIDTSTLSSYIQIGDHIFY